MKTISAITAVLFLLSGGIAAADDHPVEIMSSGSLRGALTEMIQVFSQQTGITVEPHFGAAGSLRERIEKGEATPDLFASADLAAPQALADAGKAGPVVLFARNRMCAMARPGLTVTSATLLTTLLNPKVTIGTSKPIADPGGDYAWAIFARAEAAKPGSRAILEDKAHRFLDRPNPQKAPEGTNPLAWMLGTGQVDLFLAYCTGGKAVLDHLPGASMIELPPELKVTPEIGMTLLSGSTNPAAARFALFILSRQGQEILTRNGFEAPSLPQSGH